MPTNKRRAETERKQALLADNLARQGEPVERDEPRLYVERTLDEWARGAAIDADSLAFNIAARIAADIRRHREYPKDWDAVAVRVFRGRLTDYLRDVLQAAEWRVLAGRQEGMRAEDYQAVLDATKAAVGKGSDYNQF